MSAMFGSKLVRAERRAVALRHGVSWGKVRHRATPKAGYLRTSLPTGIVHLTYTMPFHFHSATSRLLQTLTLLPKLFFAAQCLDTMLKMASCHEKSTKELLRASNCSDSSKRLFRFVHYICTSYGIFRATAESPLGPTFIS